ncbi:MAG: popeye domain-containing protein [Bacteroidetes bacterium]|nr:popeye domain-containing protein [Bacteroidota bacterium]
MQEFFVILFFIANIIYTSSYAVRDIMWLRILTIMGALCTFPYFFFQDTPLWSALFWQTMFITINAVNLVFLYLERRPVDLDDDQKRLHLLVFRSLKHKEMLKLLSLAQWQTIGKGEKIIEKGAVIDNLYLLFRGEAEVESDGKIRAHLRDGRFMGEMSYITGQPTSANIIATEDTRYLSWTKESLNKFFVKNSTIKNVMQAILGYDMAEKLKAHE